MSNFISGQDLLTRLNIFPFELFDHVKKGLQPLDQFGRPIMPPDVKSKSERLKKIKMQLEENPRTLRLTEGTIEATSPPGSRLRLLGDLQRRYALMNKSLQNEIETLTKELDKIENKYSWSNYELPEDQKSAKWVIDLLRSSYFLIEDVATIGKTVIKLDPEKLNYPERINAEKLKIIKEIAATEDLKKLKELKQFDEDTIEIPNKWDDATVETAINDTFCNALEVGKREGLNENIEIAESKLQSIRGKKGGEKSKINKPILLAIKKYLQDHPKLEGKTNYQIAESFKRHVGKNEPIIVNFNECEWDVYFADNYIEAIADATNKKKHKDKSIAYSTFMNSYISKAKK
jgi:hypothetical protein